GAGGGGATPGPSGAWAAGAAIAAVGVFIVGDGFAAGASATALGNIGGPGIARHDDRAGRCVQRAPQPSAAAAAAAAKRSDTVPRSARAAQCLIGGQDRIGDGERAAGHVRAASGPVGASAAIPANPTAGPAAPREVPGHGTLVEGQRAARDIDAAALAHAAASPDDADRLVPGHGDAFESQ